MGCCVSSLDYRNNANLEHSLSKNGQFACVSKSPPRPEEETVKEVLSETPKPRPEIKPEVKASLKCDGEPTNEEKPTKAKIVVSPNVPTFEKKVSSLEQKKDLKYSDTVSTADEEISQVSEMCSLSESISTTTLEEQLIHHQQWGKDNANSGEVRQVKEFRSQGHNGNFKHGHNYGGYNNSNIGQNNVQFRRDHGRSPARRADPSPPKRRLPGPDSGLAGTRSDVLGGNSARRSQSPAMRSNVGRSPSARGTGPSPGRVRMVHGPESVKRLDVEEGEVHVNGYMNEDVDGNGWEGPKESLENPLVSLECFIFL